MYLVVLIALAIPLGRYISKVMEGERVFLSALLEPCERGIYAVLGIRSTDEIIICLTTPVVILIGSGIAALMPAVAASLHNPGAHGFTELLYAYTSAGANNGSSFAGLNANTAFLNITLGIVMLVARFLPLLATLALAGGFALKKKNALTTGTLVTTNALFVVLLVIVVFLVGALSFFPALSLGPLAEQFQSVLR